MIVPLTYHVRIIGKNRSFTKNHKTSIIYKRMLVIFRSLLWFQIFKSCDLPTVQYLQFEVNVAMTVCDPNIQFRGGPCSSGVSKTIFLCTYHYVKLLLHSASHIFVTDHNKRDLSEKKLNNIAVLFVDTVFCLKITYLASPHHEKP